MLHRIGAHAMPQFPPRPVDPPKSSPAAAGSGEPRFLEQVANTCRVRRLAYRTEQSYVAWARWFILFHNKRHPTDMGATEVRAFLTRLGGTQPARWLNTESKMLVCRHSSV